jgi:hypothetical protein
VRLLPSLRRRRLLLATVALVIALVVTAVLPFVGTGGHGIAPLP